MLGFLHKSTLVLGGKKQKRPLINQLYNLCTHPYTVKTITFILVQRILTLDFPCNKFQKLPNLVTLYLRNEIAGGRESGFVRARQALGRIVGCRIFRDFRQGEHQRQGETPPARF